MNHAQFCVDALFIRSFSQCMQIFFYLFNLTLKLGLSSLPCIELAHSVIGSCNITSVVRVQALPFVPTAASLTLQATSLDDYTMLSTCSDWLEQEGLLKQVSVVYANQLLQLRVNDEVIIQVRVLSNQPSIMEAANGVQTSRECIKSNSRQGRSIWEEQGSANHFEEEDGHTSTASQAKCWRLVADTELTVLPPPQLSPPPTTNVTCRLYPSQLDYFCNKSLPPSVSQCCALVHPQLLDELQDAPAVNDARGSHDSPLYIRITIAREAIATTEQQNATPSSRKLRMELSDQVPTGWIGTLCKSWANYASLGFQ
jgi:hypothetical protein